VPSTKHSRCLHILLLVAITNLAVFASLKLVFDLDQLDSLVGRAIQVYWPAGIGFLTLLAFDRIGAFALMLAIICQHVLLNDEPVHFSTVALSCLIVAAQWLLLVTCLKLFGIGVQFKGLRQSQLLVLGAGYSVVQGLLWLGSASSLADLSYLRFFDGALSSFIGIFFTLLLCKLGLVIARKVSAPRFAL
jgi:hypothetical protein